MFIPFNKFNLVWVTEFEFQTFSGVTLTDFKSCKFVIFNAFKMFYYAVIT